MPAKKNAVPNTASAEAQLASFIAKFTPEVAALAKAIRSAMRDIYPAALELAYDNYNALVIGFAPTEKPSEAIFSIAVFPRSVSLCFLQARGLPDPGKILQGSGSVSKHLVLPSPEKLNDPAVKTLMREAVARARVPFQPAGAHWLIIRSVSAKQRPRRPVKA